MNLELFIVNILILVFKVWLEIYMKLDDEHKILTVSLGGWIWGKISIKNFSFHKISIKYLHNH